MVVIINKYCGIIKQGLQIVKGETANWVAIKLIYLVLSNSFFKIINKHKFILSRYMFVLLKLLLLKSKIIDIYMIKNIYNLKYYATMCRI